MDAAAIRFGYAWLALRSLGGAPEDWLPRLAPAGFTVLETSSFADPEHTARARDAGLTLGAAMVYLGSVDEARRAWDAAVAAGAAYARFKLLTPHHPRAEVDACLTAIEALQRGSGLPGFLETHRDTAFQDLPAIADILAEHPWLRCTLDVSHLRVAGDWPPAPRTPLEGRRRSLLLDRVCALHLRVSDGERIQAPLWPANEPEIAAAVATWADAARRWSARRETLPWFPAIAELLPPRYAEHDREGRELTDRWADSRRLRDLLAAALA